jgi:hypothetical protein
MGQKLNGTDIRMAPNKKYTEIKMGENIVMQTSFDGTKGYMAQMGQKKILEGDELKEALDDRGIIPQLHYITSDYKTAYLGTGKAGNENAYKLKVTKPSGKVSTEYYSMKTGLLLKEETTQTAGGQEMVISIDYADYKKAGNILFPFTVTQTVGEQEFVMNITEMKVNEGVTAADFK